MPSSKTRGVSASELATTRSRQAQHVDIKVNRNDLSTRRGEEVPDIEQLERGFKAAIQDASN